MSATEQLLALDPTKTVKSHKDILGPMAQDNRFSHSDCHGLQDPTGISVEEGELLYGLVRTVKPLSVLETGTNIGVSASYIGLALKENGKGRLTTLEKDATCAGKASEKLFLMGLKPHVDVVCMRTGEFFASLPADRTFDFLWLDTELRERYAELVALWPRVSPGGVICIHDLWSLDHEWYGGVPPEMREWIKRGDLRGLTLQTDHGVTVFQKRRTVDHFADLSSS